MSFDTLKLIGAGGSSLLSALSETVTFYSLAFFLPFLAFTCLKKLELVSTCKKVEVWCFEHGFSCWFMQSQCHGVAA